MKVILLAKVHQLGDLGDVVEVKPGYGRNYLIPQGKAIPATDKNREKFESRRADLEQAARDHLAAAQERAKQIEPLVSITITAKIHDEGKLFGSIGVREIADALQSKGIQVEKREINIPSGPIHTIGEHDVNIILHSDVVVALKVKVEPEA